MISPLIETTCSRCQAPTLWDADLGKKPLCQRCWDCVPLEHDAAVQREFRAQRKREATAAWRQRLREQG